MTESPLYPILFEPIYQYRLWGGRRLANLLTEPLPSGPIGEAWVLSDRDDYASKVTNGKFKGHTIHQLMLQFPDQLMGRLAHRFQRFPLLLKFLDCREMLSVQVHPSDAHTELIPAGESGKTEAWVVLEAGSQSRIYEGLKPGTTRESLQSAVNDGTVEDCLVSFIPKPGDGFFTPAGTVHSLGRDIVVFEVQQNSDVTFRLYDWKHIDAQTSKPRALQVDQALASIDFSEGQLGPVSPLVESTDPVKREKLFDSKPFSLFRVLGKSPFTVGSAGVPRVLVCVDGAGDVKHADVTYAVEKGNVVLLPAVLGTCCFQPRSSVTLLEIELPTEKGQ